MKSAICAVLCITGVSLFLSNERNRHAFASKGSIQEGAMFGISVGDTRLTVDKFLQKRGYSIEKTEEMKIDGMFTRNHCYSKRLPDNLTPSIYRDNSWRRGSLCVVYDDGKVAEIHW